MLTPEIQRVWQANLQVYDADKVVAATAARRCCGGTLLSAIRFIDMSTS